MPHEFSSIVIIGGGLIGGSVAAAVRSRSSLVRIVTLDRGDDVATVAGSDLVLLAAPVLANIEILRTLSGRLDPRTIVTDVGSTKAAILEAAAGMRFVGGHPIAGAAAAGRGNARADLFVGQTWILTTPHGCDADEASGVETFVRSLGARPVWMEAAAHDRLFGFVSHLPQLTISALMDVVGRNIDEEGLGLAGAGLRDSTRLAASPPDIWADIVATNRPVIREALDELIATLVALRDDDTGERLRQVFERAAAARKRLQEEN